VTEPRPQRLGLFGGTFDPIHHGHLALAEAARDTLDLEIVFMPAGQPPHKPEQRVSPAPDRLAMVRAAIADNPGFLVSTLELERAGPSYTVDTLETLAATTQDLSLILSTEAVADLASWHRPERVLELATLVVVPRDGFPDLDEATVARLVPGTRPRVMILDGPRLRLSASAIRRRAAEGRSVRYLVPDAVATYIGDHALYRTPST
jgi:nicotinate-nucleotide adenylyltransferase